MPKQKRFGLDSIAYRTFGTVFGKNPLKKLKIEPHFLSSNGQ